ADLVTSTIYPDSTDTDSTGSDQVKMSYNLDGSLATKADQRGVEISYQYDTARRLQAEWAVTIPSGVDGTVQAIHRVYDDLGRLTHVYSLSAADDQEA